MTQGVIITEARASRQDTLKTLSYRLNLLNMYLLYNVCNLASLEIPQVKYQKHNSKSYVDMKRKKIRKEAIEERLAIQRDIMGKLAKCETDTIEFVREQVEQCLRADGYKLKASTKGA